MKEDLDEVATSVEPFVVPAAVTARGVGRYHRPHSARGDRRNDSVGIIAGIGNAQRPNCVFEQLFGERRFVPLTGGQRDEEWPASRIDDRVKLGREATSGVPQSIDAGPPFAPQAS